MLTDEVRKERVDGAKVFLKVLETQSHIDFCDVMTRAES
jgi:hypothetical protein